MDVAGFTHFKSPPFLLFHLCNVKGFPKNAKTYMSIHYYMPKGVRAQFIASRYKEVGL